MSASRSAAAVFAPRARLRALVVASITVRVWIDWLFSVFWTTVAGELNVVVVLPAVAELADVPVAPDGPVLLVPPELLATLVPPSAVGVGVVGAVLPLPTCTMLVLPR